MRIGETCMNLIEKEAAKAFSVWAGKNEDKHIFPAINKEQTSYYINRESEGTYIMDYSFDSVAELRDLIANYCGLSEEPQILNQLAVEIYKNRFRGNLASNVGNVKNETKEIQSEQVELPEFVYVF